MCWVTRKLRLFGYRRFLLVFDCEKVLEPITLYLECFSALGGVQARLDREA